MGAVKHFAERVSTGLGKQGDFDDEVFALADPLLNYGWSSRQLRRVADEIEEFETARKVGRICRKIKKKVGTWRELVHATRLWNAIDNLDHPGPLWRLMAMHLPHVFRDPSDPNTMRFTYDVCPSYEEVCEATALVERYARLCGDLTEDDRKEVVDGLLVVHNVID